MSTQKSKGKDLFHKKQFLYTGGVFLVLSVILAVIIILVLNPFSTSPIKKPAGRKTSKSSSAVLPKVEPSSTSSPSSSAAEINASVNDWQLVLVNLKNPKPEMNPELVTLGNIQVSAAIRQPVEEFLAAAQVINPNVHLISGYRSVAYQAELFNAYVQQTMSENPSWTEEEAKSEVMKTAQPPESSEHETGLAIDMSAVDELNAEDPATASAIAEIAPQYGFVLRFPSWGTGSTGIDYEDWHFRYVGVENAKYMIEHQLTLEDFVNQLKK